MIDSNAVLEQIRTDNQTALSRLGSAKSLYAATDGELDAPTVLRATADAEYAAWQTFAAWADDEPNPAARETFEAIAEAERGHYETVVDRLDEHEPSAPPALHVRLRELDTTVERVGGLAGRIVASRRSKEQVVGYFVGDADPETASVFRAFGDDLDDQLERTRALVESVPDDADVDRLVEAASAAIEAAYGEYVDDLERLGANPKPVC